MADAAIITHEGEEASGLDDEPSRHYTRILGVILQGSMSEAEFKAVIAAKIAALQAETHEDRFSRGPDGKPTQHKTYLGHLSYKTVEVFA